MPKNKYTLTSALFAFLIPTLGFSQSDSLKNSVISIRQVNEIVIGNKPEVQKQVEKNIIVNVLKPKATFPGSIAVIDFRDSIEFQIIPADDDVIATRIKSLENIMPMPYNEHVKK